MDASKPVFISYRRSIHAPQATALKDLLGEDVAFLDTADLPAGRPFPEPIYKALVSARVVVLFVDSAYFESWYCQREYRLALAPYMALRDNEATEGTVSSRLLRGVVIAMPVDAEWERVKYRLPSQLRTTAWPPATAPHELKAVVEQRLADPECRSVAEWLGAPATYSLLKLLESETQLPPPTPRRDWPQLSTRSLLHLKPSLGEHFVGRSRMLWRIHEALLAAERTGVVTLHGLGGMGKTRLACEYIWRHGLRHYPGGVFWLEASDPALRAPQLHRILSLLAPGTSKLSEMTPEKTREELALALGHHASRHPVLWVIDDLPEAQLDVTIDDWCPGGRGSVAILVTSRRQTGLDSQHMEVEPLDSEAAFLLLNRNLPTWTVDLERARAIGTWVGNLPLALELLNRAFLLQALTPDDFLRRCGAASVSGQLDTIMSALRTQVPAGSLRGISETFLASYTTLSLAARQLALVLAHYAPEPIPQALMRALDESTASMEARAELVNHSLVTGGTQETLGSMHPLLVDALRKISNTPEHCHIAAQGLLALMFGKNYRQAASWELFESLIPHALALYHQEQLSWPQRLRVADCAASYWDVKGPYRQAEEVRRWMVEQATRLLGEEALQTAAYKASLASTLWKLEKWNQALPLEREVLRVRREQLGDEHPDTLTSLNNLASTFYSSGDYAQAARLFREILEKRQRVLGESSADVVDTTSNLAASLMGLGELEEAQLLSEKALRLYQTLYGMDHHDTLVAMGNLATLYRLQSKLLEAKRMFTDLLAMEVRLLGPEHPKVLLTQNQLAMVLGDLGDSPMAVQLHQETLEARNRILGPEHPNTILSLQNLAVALGAVGQHEQARELGERAAALARRVFGPRHPETFTCLESLALAYRDSGELTAACVLEGEVLQARKQVLGTDHPDTIDSMATLALMWREQGELARAAELSGSVLEMAQRRFGERHPTTLLARSHLAAVVREQGDRQRAEQLHRELLEQDDLIRQKAPWLLDRVQLQYAITLRELGQHDRASALLEEVLRARQQQLGPESPDTLRCWHELATLAESAGDHGRAVELYERVLAGYRSSLAPRHLDRTRAAWALWRLYRQRQAQEGDELLRSELRWLVEANPADLAGIQREIRQRLIEVLDPDRRG